VLEGEHGAGRVRRYGWRPEQGAFAPEAADAFERRGGVWHAVAAAL
jgi:hypothetical protein